MAEGMMLASRVHRGHVPDEARRGTPSLAFCRQGRGKPLVVMEMNDVNAGCSQKMPKMPYTVSRDDGSCIPIQGGPDDMDATIS
jgi:hypothetical protein